MVGSFYDPELDEGCAFEELISFHGGLGGPQTRPFILHPERLGCRREPILGAAAVHALLSGWRKELNGVPDRLGATARRRMIRGRLRRHRPPRSRADTSRGDDYIEIDPAELSGIFSVPPIGCATSALMAWLLVGVGLLVGRPRLACWG